MSNGKSEDITDSQREDNNSGDTSPLKLQPRNSSDDKRQEQDEDDEIEALLARASEGSLNSEEQQRVASLLSVTVSHHEAYSGPYPPPELLSQYSESVQNEICTLARSYHEHKMQTDWFDRQTAAEERRRGQHYGLGIAVVGLVATCIISFVSPVTATVVGALDLLGLTAVFAYPRYLESKNRSGIGGTNNESSD